MDQKSPIAVASRLGYPRKGVHYGEVNLPPLRASGRLGRKRQMAVVLLLKNFQ